MSLSHLYELFEVLVFDSETNAKMDYSYITAKERRQGSYSVDDNRIRQLFGTKEEYYNDLAKTFYAPAKDAAIWNDKHELNLNLSWLNPEDRDKKKSVWSEVKKLFIQLSADPTITNKTTHKYSKITLGQLVLFTTLFRIKERMVILLTLFICLE